MFHMKHFVIKNHRKDKNMPSLSEILIYTGETPLAVIVWALFLGATIATLISFVVKVKFGAFMQTLLNQNANSPENAVTLNETGLSGSFFVKLGLKMHGNYKNLMVAITDDGRFYANDIYTPTPPMFKEFIFQHRIRKNKIKESQNTEEFAPSDETEESAMSRRLRIEAEKEAARAKTPDELAELEEAEKWNEYRILAENSPKQRPNFDIKTAKFYIPPELHDRAASIYISKPTKFLYIILAILGLALLALFAETIINLLTDFFDSFIDGIGGSNIL